MGSSWPTDALSIPATGLHPPRSRRPSESEARRRSPQSSSTAGPRDSARTRTTSNENGYHGVSDDDAASVQSADPTDRSPEAEDARPGPKEENGLGVAPTLRHTRVPGPLEQLPGTSGKKRSTRQPSGLVPMGFTLSTFAHPNCLAGLSRGFASS